MGLAPRMPWACSRRLVSSPRRGRAPRGARDLARFCPWQGRKAGDIERFIGIDVSLAAAAVGVLDARGVVEEAKLASEPEALTAFGLGLPFAVTAVRLEAGPLSQWLHEALADAGTPVVLMETRPG